ncbi:hypothetical protein JCM10207_002482 [Rhodosporidiobolus poonsookiae]
MRRIFGGTSLAGSSTSSSLASDALPSPTSTSAPSLSHGASADAPVTPTGDSFPHTGAGDIPDAARKGWFGTLGGGLVRTASSTGSVKTAHSAHQRTPSTASSATGLNGLFGGGGANGARGAGLEDEDEFSPERLPFGQARALSPPLSPPSASNPRRSSRSSLTYGGGGRPFSPEGVLASAGVDSKAVHKDALLVELLSGAAALEAKEYEVLDWEEMQEVKKEHALLTTRLASLTRSLALETRLRDSAAKLVRLSSPSPSSSSSSSSNPSSSARPSKGVSHSQASAQLSLAQSKVDALTSEHAALAQRAAALQTRLLMHTAGVLALSLRKKEEEEQGVALSLAASTSSRTGARDTPSPTAAGAQHTPKAGQAAFDDGRHFFANNRDAVVPLPASLSRSTGSPYASPNLSSSQGAFPSSSSQTDSTLALQHDLAAAQADLSAAQSRVGELEAALSAAESARLAAEEKARTAEGDLAVVRGRASEEGEAQRGQRDEAVRERDEARREWEEAVREKEAAERERDEAVREKEAAERERDAARGAGDDSHRAVVQSVGDVLRRHRTRPVLGAVLRAVPALEDGAASPLPSPSGSRAPTPAPAAGAAGVAQTLDAHFAAASKHVEALQARVDGLEADLSSARALASSSSPSSTSDADLAAARARAEELESSLAALQSDLDLALSDVSSLTLERDAAQLELETLRAEAGDKDGRIAGLLQAAGEDEGVLERLRGEVDALRGEREEVEKLWGELPPHGGGRGAATPKQGSSPSLLGAKVGGFFADVASKVAASVPQSGSSSSLASNATASTSPSSPPSLSLSRSPSLGAVALPSTAADEDGAFSVSALVERVRGLVSEWKELRERVGQLEGEASEAREKHEGAERAREEGEREREGLERKIQELEERIEVSANQEVQMLERLNDLTESLESTRTSKRQLETQLSSAASSASHASSASVSSSAGTGADDAEVQELRDTIADLEEELADARAREQKTRAGLLEELSTVQNEVSSLKTQLRRAQRAK